MCFKKHLIYELIDLFWQKSYPFLFLFSFFLFFSFFFLFFSSFSPPVKQGCYQDSFFKRDDLLKKLLCDYLGQRCFL